MWPSPRTRASFGQFAAAVAQRYAPQGVQDFEIWNEPNNTVFWQPAPNPAAYVQILQAADTDIKAVDPGAFVITAGLAPETTQNGNINEVTFLQDMYADGAKGYFDAVGDHPYSYPALPDTYEAWSGLVADGRQPVFAREHHGRQRGRQQADLGDRGGGAHRRPGLGRERRLRRRN